MVENILPNGALDGMQSTEPRNLAPEMRRSSYHAWCIPTTSISRARINLCLEGIARRIGTRVFAGPLSIDDEGVKGIDKEFIQPGFAPRDKQSMIWFTDENAANIRDLPQWRAGGMSSTVLNHSHAVGYHYSEGGRRLVDFTVETCKPFKLDLLNEFLFVFWQPRPGEMQYTYKPIDIGEPVSKASGAIAMVNDLIDILHQLPSLSRVEAYRAGRKMEQIILEWDEVRFGSLEDYLLPQENKAAQELYAAYEGELERMAAYEIVHNGADEKAFKYYDRYVRLNKKEREMVGFGDAKIPDMQSKGYHIKECMIGGGDLCLSAILDARAGIEVTVYEQNRERADNAKQVIKALGLSDMINIICAAAEKAKIEKHDFYKIAAMANPKKAILFNLPDSELQPVIIRTAWKQRHYLYEEIGRLEAFHLCPIDFHEASDRDDILSFVLAVLYPRNMYGDKWEYKRLIRSMIRAHGDKVFDPSCPEFVSKYSFVSKDVDYDVQH